ncbi:MAG: glycoside hydrolase family 97 catalytic domain-containing protein, partial [Sphingobacterium sp.]
DETSTAWRIIEFGKDLNALVNNDLISAVSRPYNKELFPDGLQTDWIKPGKSVWSWLSGNRSVTLDNMKQFVDQASELGIPYNLVDEGWGKWQVAGKTKWDLIRELVDYARPKNVGIWVWKAYPDRNGIPGLKEATAREAFFKECHEAGVVGVKIDFFDGESQEIIRFYEDALKDAAKYHILVDFHGADKPIGLDRTYPNELSREAIRGLENQTDWPGHNTTLPFTRYLAGHGDYTPLSFRDIVKGTTLSHQVATVALFNSAFMCLAVNPATLLSSNVLPMVKSIPVSWDETIVLPQSKIGDLVVFARRKGKDWFLCVLNGQKTKRSLTVDLSFLKGKSYNL